MRLALDNHYAVAIAERLRDKGHDVVGAYERDWHRIGDEQLLELSWEERRALLTNNVVHFMPIARRWAAERRPHAGLLLTSDAGMPRTAKNIGAYVRALDRLMTSLPAADALLDQIRWL